MTDKQQEILKNIEDWSKQHLGNSFTFRKNQKESIAFILSSILENNIETQVVQAPTGTGKSIICIICAGVLAQFYGMKSYILASDLYLWEQYATAMSKFKLKQFGFLKGSIGNYRCNENHLDLSTGKCRMAKVPLATLRNPDSRRKMGYECAETCIYMKQRFRAEKAPVTLLTYQLWLYQMNLVEHDDREGFLKRDVIFCDECHNIPDIVQKFAQPVIDVDRDREKIEEILCYAAENDISCGFCPPVMKPSVLKKMTEEEGDRIFHSDEPQWKVSDVVSIDAVLDAFDYFTDSLYISENIDPSPQLKIDMLKGFSRIINFVNSIAENALQKMSDEGSVLESATETKKDKAQRASIFKTLSWTHNYSSSISEFISAAVQAGKEYVIVEESKDQNGARSYTFSCVKEDWLCYQYILRHAKYKILTSATVGRKESFNTNIGTQYTNYKTAQFIDIPNIFDFTRSPIYVIPTYKMSYSQKKASLPKIAELIFKIMSSPNFKDKRGMINTGSYENARAIYTAAPPEIQKRLCMYTTSRDKKDTIDVYTAVKNKVIIGPSLVEGVDFPGDLCRFIIIMKVPYPNITSKIVKAKMNVFPMWYESTTSNTIIQNIGRGVRNEDDYCTTFILDGCFTRLYEETMQQYPDEIKARMKFINS